MKVLVICTNSDEAGAPIHVHTVVSNLKKECEYFVIFGEDGPVAQRLRREGVSIAVVPEMRSNINPYLDLLALIAISRHIALFQPDIIHAHSTKAGMLGRLLSIKHQVPCVFTVHGWGWRGLGCFRRYLVYLIEKILSITPKSYYIFVCNSVKREARERLGIPLSRGRVIHNGVEDFGWQPEPVAGRLRILMPARVTTAKDHESLTKAFESSSLDAELIFCGTGTDTPEFQSSLRHWAPKKNHLISTLGARSDVQQLLHNTNIFALISNFEALPLSIIEAMCANKAIIASDVGGVGELIVHDVNGLLVPKNDIEAIAKALLQFNDFQKRQEFGLSARCRYENNFSAHQMSIEVMKTYKQAIIF